MKTPPLNNPLPQELSQACQDLSLGRTNASGTFTCAANDTSTVVTDERVQVKDYIFPDRGHTANAAAESGGTALYIAPATTAGQFTVNHANNSQTDRTFGYQIVSPQESEL